MAIRPIIRLGHPALRTPAIEVSPDGSWTVLGDGVVVIYDARGAGIPSTGPLRATDVRLHVLSRGDRFTP